MKFGERFGFPALVAIILIIGLMYGLYFLLRYEVFYNRDVVSAMSETVEHLGKDHDTLLMKSEAALELQSKQIVIQCATCWNIATTQEEIKRCGCNPKQ